MKTDQSWHNRSILQIKKGNLSLQQQHVLNYQHQIDAMLMFVNSTMSYNNKTK